MARAIYRTQIKDIANLLIAGKFITIEANGRISSDGGIAPNSNVEGNIRFTGSVTANSIVMGNTIISISGTTLTLTANGTTTAVGGSTDTIHPFLLSLL